MPHLVAATTERPAADRAQAEPDDDAMWPPSSAPAEVEAHVRTLVQPVG